MGKCPAGYIDFYKINLRPVNVFIFVLILLYIEEVEPEESEEPFVAPPGLAIPPDVELVSKHAWIELFSGLSVSFLVWFYLLVVIK